VAGKNTRPWSESATTGPYVSLTSMMQTTNQPIGLLAFRGAVLLGPPEMVKACFPYRLSNRHDDFRVRMDTQSSAPRAILASTSLPCLSASQIRLVKSRHAGRVCLTIRSFDRTPDTLDPVVPRSRARATFARQPTKVKTKVEICFLQPRRQSRRGQAYPPTFARSPRSLANRYHPVSVSDFP
jgi:hypothetical protein